MRLIDKDQLRAIQLEILCNVDQFCKSHSIRYSLAYGSLLGAIRHKGYIPWDDDIDLIMPRPDYDRFIASYTSDCNEVLDLSTVDCCIEMFSKVCRKGTIMEDIRNSRRIWGVNIDVFPVDGIPTEKPEVFYNYLTDKWESLPKICPFYKGVTKNRIVWFAKYIAKKSIHPGAGRILDRKHELVKLLRGTDYDHSALSGCYFGDAGINEFMDRTIFEEYTSVIFEGKDFMAIKHSDQYLRFLYGDYMQLPPPEQRVSPHLYNSFIQE